MTTKITPNKRMQTDQIVDLAGDAGRSIGMKTALLLLSLAFLGCSAQAAPKVQDGDIIFHRSESRQSHAIAAATGSDFTHMGLIFVEGGEAFVYEAVQPVRRTRLSEWIARGRQQRYVVKRLRDLKRLNAARLRQEVERMLGKDYDWQFDWSDDRIYCSELVWKAYERACGVRLGPVKRLEDFDLSDWRVRALMAERYGKNIPLRMEVISPADVFACRELLTVEERK